jgi:sugar/nucleoside kinase (ribokinase family)
VTAKDTTACGDVFHGAYAAELARGGSVDGAVAFANAAAALKATGRGLDDTLVNRAHVRAFMNRRSSATGR